MERREFTTQARRGEKEKQKAQSRQKRSDGHSNRGYRIYATMETGKLKEKGPPKPEPAMDRERYYAISKQEGLPKRCPLVGNCERWAWSIYFLAFFRDEIEDAIQVLEASDVISPDFKRKAVKGQGEPPWARHGNYGFDFGNCCPEICLFDNHHRPGVCTEAAIVAGRYAKEFPVREEFRHFSECAEFSHWSLTTLGHQAPSKTRRSSTRRIPVSKKLRFEVFQRDEFRCVYCGNTPSDRTELELDHKIPLAEGGSDDFKNLMTSCKKCNRGKSNKIID